jgi:hypothetical protein
LDAADEAAAPFRLAVQSLKKAPLVNMLLGLRNTFLGLRNNRAAFSVAQRHLRQLDPDIGHAVTREPSLRFAWDAKDAPRSNDSVYPADTARLANYPVKTIIDRMNAEAS